MLEKMKNGLVVSCQALPDEPLHSSFIMGRMAFAAKQGGAVGIRANGIRDIKAIKRATDLPIIGIIKKKSPKSEVVITPTLNEVEQLMEVGVDIIATDATDRIRPYLWRIVPLLKMPFGHRHSDLIWWQPRFMAIPKKRRALRQPMTTFAF